ncbi:Putative ribonuclease H protein At1g65750 [Linum perenne]
MAAGQRVNPIPARTAYMPLEHPVVVISPYFRAQYPVDLNIIGEKDFTVVDVNGTTIFKLKSKSMSLHGRRKLMDASGNVLLSMSQKMMTAHRRWKLYRGDSNCKEENDDDDLLFSVRESSMLQSKNKLDVFLAGNAEEKVPDFRVEGRFGRGSCDVYLGKTDKIIAQVVAGMSPPMAGAGEDRITWGLERDGRFRVRSAYLLAAEEEGDTLDPIWRLIWRWKGPQRIRQFLWLVAHNRLLTNSERRRRHLAEIGSCQVCPGQEESVLHVLRDCPLASATWELLALSSGDQTFFQTPLLPWIERFIRKPELCLLFGVTCWWLWRARNDRVFNNKLTTAESLTRHIQAWVALVGDTLERDRFISHTGPPTRTGEFFSWEPAPPEWVTLNSDGSVLPETGQAAAGGLIRDHQGRCLAAFTMNLGKCSITRAELRGAVSGLQLAWERGYRKIQLQLDSQCAVQLLQGDDLEDHTHAATIIMARELLRRDWEVYRSHEADKFDNFKMRIYPNVDYAFIFSLVVVCLKEMSVHRMYQASSHAMEPVRGSPDVLEMLLKLMTN